MTWSAALVATVVGLVSGLGGVVAGHVLTQRRERQQTRNERLEDAFAAMTEAISQLTAGPHEEALRRLAAAKAQLLVSGDDVVVNALDMLERGPLNTADLETQAALGQLAISIRLQTGRGHIAADAARRILFGESDRWQSGAGH